MKVLLTGVAGFIGSHTAELLVARGDIVVGIDNFDHFYPREIKERNLSSVRAAAAKGGELRFAEGDILDSDLLDRLMAEGNFDVVVHLAALAGVRPSIEQSARYQRVNVEGTCRVAEAVVKHGPIRLVFASSSSVYGDNDEVPYDEMQRLDQPASPYAASKRACELLLRTFHRVHGLESCSLRFFTVYGPRQRPEMAVHKFVRLVDRDEVVTMFGDGTTSRDYTYIDDIVRGTVAAIDRAATGASLGQRVYNLGNTEPVTLRALIDAIGKALDKTPRVRELPLQAGDVMHTLANVDAARRDLAYDPQISIEEGLRRFVSWYQEQPT